MKKISKTKKITTVTMLVAIAIVFHLIESMVPIPVPIPGFKLGLANIVGLVALYYFDIKTMVVVNLSRVIIASLMRGIIFGTPFWLALTGVVLATLGSIILYKTNKFTIFGVSVIAAFLHALGQVLAVSFIYQQSLMFLLLPILGILSIPTGLATAYIAKMVLARLK